MVELQLFRGSCELFTLELSDAAFFKFFFLLLLLILSCQMFTMNNLYGVNP